MKILNNFFSIYVLTINLVSCNFFNKNSSENIEYNINEKIESNYIDKFKLKGKVKTLRFTRFKAIAEFEKIKKGEVYKDYQGEFWYDFEKFRYNFYDSIDINGRLVYSVEYNEKFIKTSERKYFYDNELLINEIGYSYGQKKSVNKVNNFFENKKLVKTISKRDSILSYEKTYRYLINNIRYEDTTKYYTDKGELLIKSITEYDEIRNLFIEKRYDIFNGVIENVKYLDSKGQIVKIDGLTKKVVNNKLLQSNSYKMYYEDGLKYIIRVNHLNNELEKSVSDLNDNILSYEMFKNENLQKSYEYTYLENRIIKKLIKEENKNDLYTYKYDFDDKGNWILKYCFKNGLPLYIEERIINYY